MRKNIALVAHDNRKKDLCDWVGYNFNYLKDHHLICTGTTGRLIEETLKKKLDDERIHAELFIKKLKSGPLGGDQQLGALIAEDKVDLLIFFWDPMQPQAHDVDVKALQRIAVLYNIPMASNRSTADYLISSPLLNEDYKRIVKDYSAYIKRDVY